MGLAAIYIYVAFAIGLALGYYLGARRPRTVGQTSEDYGKICPQDGSVCWDSLCDAAFCSAEAIAGKYPRYCTMCNGSGKVLMDADGAVGAVWGQTVRCPKCRIPPDLGCERPPAGFYCSREPGHEGPCAARIRYE